MTTGLSAELDTASRPSLRQRWFSLQLRAYLWLQRRAQPRRQRLREKNGKPVLPDHLLTGFRGEDAACFFLSGLGMQVVARRWRHPASRGDLDLVAWDGETLVIAEVKTRSARDEYAAESSVDESKRKQLRSLARAYARYVPQPFRSRLQIRFDVIAVYLLKGQEPAFEHFKCAFTYHPPEGEAFPRFFYR